MNKNEVVRLLEAHKAELTKRFGVTRLALSAIHRKRGGPCLTSHRVNDVFASMT